MSKIYSKGFQEYWIGVTSNDALWRSPIKRIAFNAYKAGIVQAQKEHDSENYKPPALHNIRT